jgi:hypothetical protein
VELLGEVAGTHISLNDKTNEYDEDNDVGVAVNLFRDVEPDTLRIKISHILYAKTLAYSEAEKLHHKTHPRSSLM